MREGDLQPEDWVYAVLCCAVPCELVSIGFT